MLPDGIVVRHKTGTIGGSTNDVGIIELPGGAGAVVTVVFVKEATADSEEREEAIAQIARSVYDYYLYKQ
jgi:beta-lactamase class A